MATKLKRIFYSNITKTIVFIIIVLGSVSLWMKTQEHVYKGTDFNNLTEYEYVESREYFKSLRNNMHILSNIYLDDADLNESFNVDDLDFYYYIKIQKNDEVTVKSNVPKSKQNAKYFKSFEVYYDVPGENLINSSDRYIYEQYDKSNIELDEKALNINDQLYEDLMNNVQECYIAIPDNIINAGQIKLDAQKKLIHDYLKEIIINGIIIIVLVLYLTIVVGRKLEDDKKYLLKFDKVYSEIPIATIFAIIIPFIMLVNFGQAYNYGYGINYDEAMKRGLPTVITATNMVFLISIFITGMSYLSLIRKLKAKIFIKTSFIYKVWMSLWKGIKKLIIFIRSFFDGSRYKNFSLTKSLFKRQVLFIVSSAIIVFFFLIFVFVPLVSFIMVILEGLLIFWYIKYNNETYDKINEGFNESFEERMKSEKMKVDLVTNVSHDLKTPLTSIISYIDLLSKEELSPVVMDYVNVLQDKSSRLKNIVADLFDLAKSTSGDINLDLEDLDIKKLIEQTLADMDDDITKSGLYIRTNLGNDPVYIYSDGKKLYRVFQNLISNTLKYSLPATRVYIDLESTGEEVEITIKNISSYELNFTSEEILQRFNRADESRTTEGSGLGLSIAESFTRVCGGKFKLEIDGDMFKVILRFNLKFINNNN